MCVLLTVNLERHRTPAVRHCIRTRTYILSHIVWCTFKMVTHRPFHIVGRQRLVGLDPERHHRTGRIIDPVKIFVHALRVTVEKRPYTCVTTAKSAEVCVGISERETEVLVVTVKITHLACKRNHIGAIKRFRVI